MSPFLSASYVLGAGGSMGSSPTLSAWSGDNWMLASSPSSSTPRLLRFNDHGPPNASFSRSFSSRANFFSSNDPVLK